MRALDELRRQIAELVALLDPWFYRRGCEYIQAGKIEADNQGFVADTISEHTAAAGVTVDGVLLKDGLVDSVDVGALETDVDGFPDELKNLTTAEIQQLENIGAELISAAEWAILAALDQALATTNSPTFDDLNLTGSVKQSTALGCRVYRNSAQTISTATVTALSFSHEINDTDTCWAVGDPTKLYARTAGYYSFGASVAWTGNATGSRIVYVRKDGTTILCAERDAGLGVEQSMSVSGGQLYFAADEYIEVMVYQNSGGDLDVVAASTTDQHKCCAWLSRCP